MAAWYRGSQGDGVDRWEITLPPDRFGAPPLVFVNLVTFATPASASAPFGARAEYGIVIENISKTSVLLGLQFCRGVFQRPGFTITVIGA